MHEAQNPIPICRFDGCRENQQGSFDNEGKFKATEGWAHCRKHRLQLRRNWRLSRKKVTPISTTTTPTPVGRQNFPMVLLQLSQEGRAQTRLAHDMALQSTMEMGGPRENQAVHVFDPESIRQKYKKRHHLPIKGKHLFILPECKQSLDELYQNVDKNDFDMKSLENEVFRESMEPHHEKLGTLFQIVRKQVLEEALVKGYQPDHEVKEVEVEVINPLFEKYMPKENVGGIWAAFGAGRINLQAKLNIGAGKIFEFHQDKKTIGDLVLACPLSGNSFFFVMVPEWTWEKPWEGNSPQDCFVDGHALFGGESISDDMKIDGLKAYLVWKEKLQKLGTLESNGLLEDVGKMEDHMAFGAIKKKGREFRVAVFYLQAAKGHCLVFPARKCHHGSITPRQDPGVHRSLAILHLLKYERKVQK